MSTPQPARSGTAYRVGVAVVVALLLLPIVTQRFAPLVDFPNHLARAFMLRHYEDVPAFSAWFTRALQPVPNSALDAALVVLQGATDVVTAGRLFLAAVVLTWVAGVHALARVSLGRSSLVALPCMMLVYNSSWLYGFVNYVMGLALFMLTFAAWLHWRRAWSAGRMLLVATLATVTYLAHLSGFAVLGLAVAGVIGAEWVRGERPSLRRLVSDGVPLLPPVVLFLAFMEGEGRASVISWSVASKVVGLLPFLRTYDTVVDAVVVALLLVALVVLVRHRARLRVDHRLAGAAVALFAAFLLAPWEALTGTAVDQRFAPPAMLLGILALRHSLAERARRLLVALALVATGLRVGDMWYRWQQLQSPLADAWALAGRVPEGARVYPLYVPPGDRDAAKADRALEHAPLFAVITSRAYLPTVLAIEGTQPLVYREAPPYRVPREDGEIPLLAGYDLVWRHGVSDARGEAFLERCCRPRERRGDFELLDVRGSGGSGIEGAAGGPGRSRTGSPRSGP